METQATMLRIEGLTTLEKLELEKHISKDDVRFESPVLSSEQHGELMTTAAVVVLTLAALKGIAAWLLKTRRRQVITKTIEIIHPDGRKETHTITIDLTESQSPEADVLKALSDAFKFDPQMLLGK